MSEACLCGSIMHRHGSRTISIIDHDLKGFKPSQSVVQRFRCATCHQTRGIENPELEPGFKLSREACERVLEKCMDLDLNKCAELSGIDKSVISRLLAHRSNVFLAETAAPSNAQLSLLRPNLLLVSDAMTRSPAAFFNGIEDDRLRGWIGQGEGLVFACDQTAAHLLNWNGSKATGMPAQTFSALCAPLIERAAERLCQDLTMPNTSAGVRAPYLLSTPSSKLSFADHGLLGQIAYPGSPARHFIRLRDQLSAIHQSSSITEAKDKLNRWLADCCDYWSKIFGSLKTFVTTYRGMLLTSHLSLNNTSPRSIPITLRPANVLNHTFAYAKSRQKKPEARQDIPAFARAS